MRNPKGRDGERYLDAQVARNTSQVSDLEDGKDLVSEVKGDQTSRSRSLRWLKNGASAKAPRASYAGYAPHLCDRHFVLAGAVDEAGQLGKEAPNPCEPEAPKAAVSLACSRMPWASRDALQAIHHEIGQVMPRCSSPMNRRSSTMSFTVVLFEPRNVSTTRMKSVKETFLDALRRERTQGTASSSSKIIFPHSKAFWASTPNFAKAFT